MLNRLPLSGLLCFSLFTSLFTMPALLPEILPGSMAFAQETEVVAILGLKALGNLSPEEAELVTSRVRSLVVQNPRFQVLDREGMDRILTEAGYLSSQSCESEDCSLKAGRKLAARKVITGSLSKVGQVYTLTLRILDVEQGRILAERFVDCACSQEALLFEQVSPLLQQLLGEVPTTSSTQPIQEIPVRKLKPLHVGLEGGYSDYWGLTLGYNINEYVALRLGVTYHQEQLNSNFNTPAGVGAVGALRTYFNPHDLAGFAEVAATTELWFIPRLGLEYRNKAGLNLWLAGGWRYRYVNGGVFDAVAGVGYAF
jgi:hypothetical protein